MTCLCIRRVVLQLQAHLLTSILFYFVAWRYYRYTGEGFGDLDSLSCPLSGDKMDGMMDVGGEKCLWMTISGLLKLRMLFEVQSKDSGGMDISIR